MKPKEVELKDIIEGCKRGDKRHQQAIYQKLYSPMLSICARYARDMDEAKDILQDGFIKVFEKVENYNMEGSFEGWIRRIIVNTAIDCYRKKKKEILVEDNSRFDEDFDDTEESPIYEGINIGDVVKAMQQLSPAYRTVFNLYVMDGYSHQEIADELEISIGTSKSNLAKAKANIKSYLLEKLYEHK